MVARHNHHDTTVVRPAEDHHLTVSATISHINEDFKLLQDFLRSAFLPRISLPLASKCCKTHHPLSRLPNESQVSMLPTHEASIHSSRFKQSQNQTYVSHHPATPFPSSQPYHKCDASPAECTSKQTYCARFVSSRIFPHLTFCHARLPVILASFLPRIATPPRKPWKARAAGVSRVQ